jgi:H+/gluconate symporter-like permease
MNGQSSGAGAGPGTRERSLRQAGTRLRISNNTHAEPAGSSPVLIFVAVALALPTWYLGSYLFGLWAGRKFVLPVPTILGTVEAEARKSPPEFGTVLMVLLLPLGLIFLNTGLGTLATAGAVDGDAVWVQLLRMIGQTPVALLITVLVAMWRLGVRDHSDAALEKIMARLYGRSAPSSSSPGRWHVRRSAAR